jgi:hypothetical protein
MTTLVPTPDFPAANGSVSAVRTRSHSPAARWVVALTVIALMIRFYRIEHQGLWNDEAYTVMLVKLPFTGMLSRISKTESTPYLYYILAWVWTHIFGRGAGDIRALSALLGAAVVPVAYLAAHRLLASRRAALITAALATFNPLLIWYSQEARAYELLVLTSALTLLTFARACELRAPRRLGAWALAAAVALATHYDAALIVLPEAIWLLARYWREVRVWLAVAFVAACGGGLMPLLIAQDNSRNASWIEYAPLSGRLAQILPQFLIGTGSHAYTALMWAGFALAAGGLVFAAASGRDDRRRALAVGSLAAAGFGLAMLVVAGGTDTLLTRNLLALWLPAAMAIAVGLGSRRAGRLGAGIAAAICALGLTATLSVATDYTLQRPDWPAVVRALGPWPDRGQSATSGRLLIFQANPWLESLTQVYMEDTHYLQRVGHYRDRARAVTEIDIIANTAPRQALNHWRCWWGAGCNLYPTKLKSSYPIHGFREVGVVHVKQFWIMRMVSADPELIDRRQLVLALGKTRLNQSGILIQRFAAG